MRLLLKLGLLFTIVLLIIVSCKKDNKPSIENYMKFRLDGVQVECDRKFFAIHKSTAAPDAEISFYAGWGDNLLSFQIFTYGSTDITAGQYVFGPGKAYWAQLWPNGTFPAPGVYYSYEAGAQIPSATIQGSGQVTIIEINADLIKGSFDFITGVNSTTGLFKTVTNGEFLIKRG
jgi:hypothetical protein